MDELPTRARALLEAARAADDPTPGERERADAVVRAGLALHGVHLPPPHAAPSSPGSDLSTSSPGASGTALSGSSGALAARVLVAAVVLGGGGWLGLGALSRSEQAPAAAPQHATQAPAAPRAEPGPPALPLAAVRALGQAASAVPARVASSTRRTGRSGALHAGSLDLELELIAEADLHLRGARFDAALRTLARHARRFPRGALREERAALRVLALCGDAPGPDAKTQRARFLRESPSSVLTARVSAACAADGAPAR